jgi:hypothetical protein
MVVLVQMYLALAVVDILDYANTNKYKTVRSISGVHDMERLEVAAGLEIVLSQVYGVSTLLQLQELTLLRRW